MKKIRFRASLPMAGILFVFALIAARLAQLQLAMHKPLNEKTIAEISSSIRKKSLRGRILDRRNRVLAVSVERPSIAVWTKEVRVPREILARRLSGAVTGVSQADLARRLRGPESKFVWVKRLAGPEEAERAKALKLEGIVLEPEHKRLYPYGDTARELLGSVGLDGEGTGGLEYGLDSLLRGEESVHLVLKDALGRVFGERLAKQVAAPVLGQANGRERLGPYDIYLTLDAELQSLVEKHLEAGLMKHEAKLVSAIVQESATGAILAMASRQHSGRMGKFPNLDPNTAASFTFEPGSVIKPFIMASALEADAVQESDRIDCEGGRFVLAPDRVIRDHEPYQALSPREVLAYSSNIGMVKIGSELDPQPFYSALRAFGFGTKTTLPLAGEAVGILKPPEEWSQHSQAMMSFGYEIGTTLLQLVNATSALAHEGTLLEPQIVAQVKKSRSDEVIYNFKPRRVRETVTPKTAQRTLAMMEAVVEYGTGKLAGIPGYRVAGKTGTAQKLDPATNKHSSTRVVVSFCGALPMPKPEFAICVMLDEPLKPKVAWASDLAVPLFNQIAQDAVNIFPIPPQMAAANAPKAYVAHAPSP